MYDIIAVDDSPEIREILLRALRKHGWQVAAFASPIEAGPEIDKVGTRVLLTDINMPEMDGATFAHQLRRKHPKLPIIALTASMDLDDLDRSDFTEALAKPFRIAELLRVLSGYLDSSDGPGACGRGGAKG